MRDPKLARKAFHFVVPLIILQSIFMGFLYDPVSGQEPDVVDIGGGRREATWHIDDPGFYSTDNVSIQGGEANLSLNSYSWFESQHSDFQDGTWDNNVTLTSDGNITLQSDNTNLVGNGDFSSDSDWTYLNGTGSNVVAEWDIIGENAHLHHHAPPGASALIEDFEYSGNMTNWSTVGAGTLLYSNNSGHLSSGSMDIGWRPLLPTDDGGARRISPPVSDWSPFNRLSLWIVTEYPGPDTLQVRINVIDSLMVSWASARQNVVLFPVWREYRFDLQEFTGDISQIDTLIVLFDGISGDGFTEYRVTIDDIRLYHMKTFDEVACGNQTFFKANWTDSSPGSVMLSFDAMVEDNSNIASSYLNVSVSNASSTYRWEKASIVPPFSSHVVVDLSWLMMEQGNYDISMSLWLSVSTRLETSYSARFDNFTIVAPNRKNGTYISEPYDTLSPSVWKTISSTEGSPDPETSIHAFTRTGNSNNTSDGSWSGWQSPGPSITSPPNRYIQYRVDLETVNASKGPTLLDMRIDYDQYSPTGTLETDNFTVSDLYVWEEFRVIDVVVPGTDITYYYSPDRGGSWFSISNGSSLATVTNKTIRFKAELRTFNTTFTPHLCEMNLTYQYVGPLDHIHMSNDTISTTAGSLVYLSAWGHDSSHREVTFTQKWETTDPMGNVSQFGNYTAGKVGTWKVFCNNTDDSISNWTVVDVSVGSLVRIGIDPWDPGTLSADDQMQFNATGYDVMENIIPVAPNWTVVGGIGEMPSGPSPSSLFDATTVGSGNVIADISPIILNQTNLFSVVAGQLSSIEVSPPSVDLLPEDSTSFSAQGKDGDGNNVTLTSTVWQTNVGTITNSNSTDADFTAQSTEFFGGFVRATQNSISGEAVININDGDEPPDIQGDVPDQSVLEDHGSWILNLTSYASDEEDAISDLRWRITGRNPSLYKIAGDDIPGNHLLTFTTKQHAFGNDDVILWLIDSKDQTASQPMWINITPVNDNPTISAPDKLDVRFDVPRTVDYAPYINDVDNSLGELTLTTSDIDHTTVNGFNVTYEYPESMIGEPIFVILNVFDGMASAQDVVEVDVSGNYPPRLVTPIADIVMNEDERLDNEFDMNDHFEDPDDSQLTFGSLSQKVGIDIDIYGMVSIIPEENWFGDELVIFSATDSSGAVVQDPVLVRVLPLNDPPEISDLPDITIHYGVIFDFDVSPYISDIDNVESELDIRCSDDDNSTVLGTIVSFDYPTTAVVYVTITVSDGEYQDSDEMKITVTDNHPPVSEGLPDVVFNEDESLDSAFDLDYYFSDVEGDTLTYTVNQSQFFVDVSVAPDNVVSFSSMENWSGQQVILFRAEDEEGAIAEDLIIVTVIPVNDAPFISPIPRQEGKKNKAWLLDLSPYIYDSDNATDDLTINATAEYVTVAGHYLIFNCEESFDHRLATVSVSDGLLENSEAIEVSVSSYVNPQISMFVWPTTLGIVLLALVGLAYWRVSRKYMMEDLFVVSKDGKAMVHKTTRVRPDRDEDMLSGMMTAIRAFAEDTFREEGGTLKSFESEDKRVVLESAEAFYVAAIFAGKEPKWAEKSLKLFVEDMQLMYGPTIESWSGIMDDLGDLPEMVSFFISRKKYGAGDWTPAEDSNEGTEED